jgi:arginase
MAIGSKFRILGVPLGLGGRRMGANLGPAALRLAGIVQEVSKFAETTDQGDIACADDGERGEGLGHFKQVLAALEATRAAVSDGDGVPLILGGDHSIEMASLPVAAAQGDLGVLWIDAHADFNTPETSSSGNLHGLSLAAACGVDSGNCSEIMRSQWTELLDKIALDNAFVDPARIAWIGLRNVDPGEVSRIGEGDPKRAVSMHEIDRFGIAALVEHVCDYLQREGVSRLWVSFDVDVVDPAIAPGTGTKVRGGITYREAHLLAEILNERLGSSLDLAGVTVAEVNPTLDLRNSSAALCVEWVASLLGKRILPPWPEA